MFLALHAVAVAALSKRGHLMIFFLRLPPPPRAPGGPSVVGASASGPSCCKFVAEKRRSPFVCQSSLPVLTCCASSSQRQFARGWLLSWSAILLDSARQQAFLCRGPRSRPPRSVSVLGTGVEMCYVQLQMGAADRVQSSKNMYCFHALMCGYNSCLKGVQCGVGSVHVS
jgi:hypothetical protein